MNKKRKLNAWKKLTILAAVIIFIALVICLGWVLLIDLPYTGYANGFEAVQTELEEEKYKKTMGEFKCEVLSPPFLGTGGFLAVRSGKFSATITDDGKLIYPDEPNISLFIWPSVIKKTTYGIMISFENKGVSNAQFMIEFSKNEDGSYNITHTYEDQKTIDVFNEYKGTIDKMLDCAEETWDFDGLDDIAYGFKVRK